MRGNVRLLEKERRCLDLVLMVQSAQDSAGVLILDSLRDELGERRATQQVLRNVWPHMSNNPNDLKARFFFTSLHNVIMCLGQRWVCDPTPGGSLSCRV